jgi:hypothetical protein
MEFNSAFKGLNIALLIMKENFMKPPPLAIQTSSVSYYS